jgi:adenine deaminase
LNGDTEVMAKIALAKKYNKPVDGHAPGLKGADARKYIHASYEEVTITTDHECFTYEEALGKLQLGMKILIREGSAAKNFEALIELLHHWEDMMMFCSDDKHPDSLETGHINELCARAVAKGIDVFRVLKAACINPAEHYQLSVGQLRVDDNANFIVVANLKDFTVEKNFINGMLVAEKGKSFIDTAPSSIINQFDCEKITDDDLKINQDDYSNEVPVIMALDGQLITEKLLVKKHLLLRETVLMSNIQEDVLKIVVVNRYNKAPVAKAFIKNFGLKIGAIAGSVAHDSHNIVAVGVDDKSIGEAVNKIIEHRGGLSYYCSFGEGHCEVLPLPIAGLMTNEDGYTVSKQYTAMDSFVKNEMGATLQSPYMTLSFMALLVIPHLKLSDKGLFDGDRFEFVQF